MIIIVGAGLAGLACAKRLNEAGADWLMLEAASTPGGRVATHRHKEGYLLDAGFQVLLDSYPTARRLVDYSLLKPRYFDSGALLVSQNGEWERFLNPIAHPHWAFAAACSKAFTLREKLSLASLTALQLLHSDEVLLAGESGYSTMDEIKRLGLGGGMLERFLRPFFGGVFLDNDLGADASIFRYDLKKFALGRALLPASGMGEIPRQLAETLPSNRLRYQAEVTALHFNGERISGVELSDGEVLKCDTLILATDERTSRKLLKFPLSQPHGGEWLGVTTLYFSGEEPLYEGALLVLPEGKDRLVRHFTDLTNTAPEYAPAGKRLLSATILTPFSGDMPAVALRARAEISALFPSFARWSFLQGVHIPFALPSRLPGYAKTLLPSIPASNIYLAGDQVSTSSIESALSSGWKTAGDFLSSPSRS
jgi:phytoene dehydrogenase-like protein